MTRFGDIFTKDQLGTLNEKFLNSLLVENRQWKKYEDGQKICCQSIDDPHGFYVYERICGLDIYACGDCNVKKRYTRAKTMTNAFGQDLLFEYGHHSSKCRKTRQQLMEMEKIDPFAVDSADSSDESKENSFPKKITRYSDVAKVTANYIPFANALQVPDKKWGHIGKQKIWIQASDSMDKVHVFYQRPNGLLFTCLRCEHKQRYSKAAIVKDIHKNELCFEKSKHSEECKHDFNTLMSDKRLLRRKSSLASTLPIKKPRASAPEKMEHHSPFFAKVNSSMFGSLNDKNTSSASEDVNWDESSLKGELNGDFSRNDSTNERKMVRYSDVFKITKLNSFFKDAVQIMDRNWGYVNPKKIWIEVPGKTDRFYLYTLKDERYRRLVCYRCEYRKIYSKIEVIQENGSKRLFELSYHIEKCEYTQDQLDLLPDFTKSSIFNNSNSSFSKSYRPSSYEMRRTRSQSVAPRILERSTVSVKFEASEVSVMPHETEKKSNNLQLRVRAKSECPESTGPVLRQRQSEGSRAIVAIKPEDFSTNLFIPSDRWILPCDKNNIAKGKLFIVSKKDPQLGAEFNIERKSSVGLIFRCQNCRLVAKVTYKNKKIEVEIIATRKHEAECYLHNLLEKLKNEKRVLINP